MILYIGGSLNSEGEEMVMKLKLCRIFSFYIFLTEKIKLKYAIECIKNNGE